MAEIRVRADIPAEIHKELGAYPEFVRRLLFYRNITDADAAKAFLNPDYKPHDPFLLKGMKEAARRLLSALKNNERITIFSDYDADGIPGAVVLHDFFKKIGYRNFAVYIPSRHSEGFGLNDEAIKEIASGGTKLIITVDCGIADAKEVALARSLGVEVIVTDHHTPTDGIPEAVAVVDPKQKGCGYPFKELCGAAVAFKLVQALCSRLRSPLEIGNWKLEIPATTFSIEWEKWLLDMVGIATLSDMVPLVGENRMFARFGLAVLRKSPRPGLNALFGALRLNRRTLSEDDIVFSISPRLNAASRMGDPMDAFKLLAANDEVEAIRLAKSLEHLNNERKGVVAGIIKEIKHTAKERNLAEKRVVVVGNPVWKPALLGLAAGTIAEEFGKPVFLWGRDTETTFKGSCRSGGGINVLELMEKAGDIFLEYGGHAGAGGFLVSFDEIHHLENDLEKAVVQCGLAAEDDDSIADAVLRLSKLDWNIVSHLEQLSPFGEGNPKPLFLIEKAAVNEIRHFGKNNVHTALRFQKNDSETIEAISFFTTPDNWGKPVDVGREISLLAHIEQSHFRGEPEIRLRIKEIL
jgi:single-stranded-DNA-specific exonuclease